MNENVVFLSKTCNSLEISRILNLPLKDVEKLLIDNYYKDSFKISKENLLECADRIYFESPALLASEFNMSEITLKKYLDVCKLFNSKKARINFNDDNIDDELIKNVTLDYSNLLSIAQLMSKYHLSKGKVKEILHNNNLSTSKITFNDLIFDKIDTEEKAYWLGFLYADGYVSGRNDNDVELSLKILDCEHLFKFKEFLQAKRLVKLDFKIKRCRFNAISKHFNEQLTKLGCTPNKSLTLKFPTKDQVPENLILPFIRGYYDGDGILSYSLKSDKAVISSGLLGTEDFLNGVMQYFPELKHTTLIKANKEGAKECKVITWSKYDSIYFLNTIYNNANIYLTRKYKRYLFFKENDFAVYKSNLVDYDRAISEEAKLFINTQYNIDFDKEYANSEISKEIKESLPS